MDDTEETRAELQAMVSALLDRYPSVLILVRDDDGFKIFAGVASNEEGVDVERYRDLIQTAPQAVAHWSRAMLDDDIPPPSRAS